MNSDVKAALVCDWKLFSLQEVQWLVVGSRRLGQALEEVWRIPDGSLLAKESSLLGKCSHSWVRSGQGESTWGPELKDERRAELDRTGWEKFHLLTAKPRALCHSGVGMSPSYKLLFLTSALCQDSLSDGQGLEALFSHCILCEWRPQKPCPRFLSNLPDKYFLLTGGEELGFQIMSSGPRI